MILGSLVEPHILFRKFSPLKYTVYGVEVATRGFYKAILRYGSFDEVHFFTFLPRDNITSEFSSFKHLKIIPRRLLPQYIAKIKYQIFFRSSPFITEIVNLRSRFATQPFPVCGYAFTISYHVLLKEMFLWNYFSSTMTFDSIVSPSRATRSALQNIDRLLKKRILVDFGLNLVRQHRFDYLPLGIDSEKYEAIGRFRARKNLNLPKEKIVILYLGRFSNYDKMVLTPLLSVYKKLISKNKNLLFIFAGSNAQNKYGLELKKIANEIGILKNAHFYFNPSERKKMILYAASDIFVSPSDNIQESFGLTLIEAMASGLAVLASDWNGYRDIISHGEDGFLIPTLWADCVDDISSTSDIFNSWERDHFLLAHSVCVNMQKMHYYLDLLVNNKNLRINLAYAAQKKIKQKYDWGVLIPRYERLWKRLYLLSRKSKLMPIGKASLFMPDYFYCFSHYASRMLKKSDIFAITPEGIEALSKINREVLSEFLRGIFSWRIAFVILDYLRGKNGCSLDEVVSKTKKVFKKTDISSQTIVYHIQWLIKNNYLIVIS